MLNIDDVLTLTDATAEVVAETQSGDLLYRQSIDLPPLAPGERYDAGFTLELVDRPSDLVKLSVSVLPPERDRPLAGASQDVSHRVVVAAGAQR